MEALRYPGRVAKATARLLLNASFYRLVGWIVLNLAADVVRLPGRLVPTALHPRYRGLPRACAPMRAAPSGAAFRALAEPGDQPLVPAGADPRADPLQRLGKTIEHLTSILALCHHAGSPTSLSSEWRSSSAADSDKLRSIRSSPTCGDGATAARGGRGRQRHRVRAIDADPGHQAGDVRDALARPSALKKGRVDSALCRASTAVRPAGKLLG